MTFPNPGPASQSTGNVAGGPYVAWSGTNTTQVIGPAGALVNLGGGVGGGVALYDGANSITSGTAQFSNANGVSFGFNAQTITASVAGFTQSNQTVASGGIAGSGFTSATTAGTAIVATNNSAGLSVGVPAYITTYAAGNATGISSIADSAHTQTVGMLSFANSNGITFGISTGALTATITASAGTAAPGISGIADSANTQTVGTLSFANSNGITFGLSTGANTATLTASFNASQYFFSNSNNITFGSNGSTVTASFSQSVQTQASGNIGATGFATTTTNGSVIVGTNNTTGFTLAVPPYLTAAGGAATLSYFEPAVRGGTGTASIGTAGTFFFQPFFAPNNVSAYRGQIIQSLNSQSLTTVSFSGSVSGPLASSATGSWGNTITVLLASRISTGTNANSSNMVTFYSNTWTQALIGAVSVNAATNVSSCTVSVTTGVSLSFIKNIDSAGGTTGSTTGTTGSTSFSSTGAGATTFSSSFAMTSASALASGLRPIDFPCNFSMPAGEYWFGVNYSTQTGTTNLDIRNLVNMTVPRFVIYSTNTTGWLSAGATASVTGTGPQQGWGSYGTSASTTTTMALNTMSNNSNLQLWFNLQANTL